MSALVVLVVSVPTMAIEEDWHGRPMIDQPTHLWILAALLVAGAFVVGGALAGLLRPQSAMACATAAATLALGVLLVAAVSRRFFVVHEGVSSDVARLWFFGVVSALALSAVGSQLGRWLTRHV
jgi:heme/copper-type cytochrome/quinol oxidase subunit 3